MSDFYCARQRGPVRVSSEKVCGYKIRNDWMSKGWSSGLKTGKDNDCGHRLSRFSTDEEAYRASHHCFGNVNWLNHKGPEFADSSHSSTKRILGEKYELTRPSFKSGTTMKSDNVSALKPNERMGLGNFEISRSNFIAPTIMARDPVDFDKISAINTAQFGQKVQLSDKSISDLLAVKVPDERDAQWLAEKARRVALGETEAQLKANPPLGRPQRTIVRKINFGEARMGLEGDLNAIKAAVDAGRVENRADRATLGAEIARVLATAEDVARITTAQMADIATVARRIGIPTDWRKIFPHRFWSQAQIASEKGTIALFIMSNVPKGRDINKPLKYRSPDDSLIAVELSGLYKLVHAGRQTRMLDLQDLELMDAEPDPTNPNPDSASCVLNYVIANGIDNGYVDIKNTGIPEYVLKGPAPPLPARPARRTPAEIYGEAGIGEEEEKGP